MYHLKVLWIKLQTRFVKLQILVIKGEIVLLRLDLWIIGKFTKICHWLQETTGYTNYTVAAIGCMVVIVGTLAQMASTLFPGLLPGLKDHLPSWFVLPWLAILIQETRGIRQFLQNEERVYAMKTPKYLGAIWGFRLFWVLLVAIQLSASVDALLKESQWPLYLCIFEGLPIGNFIKWYAAAVTPRPPGTNKVREFLDNIGRKPVPVPNN